MTERNNRIEYGMAHTSKIHTTTIHSLTYTHSKHTPLIHIHCHMHEYVYRHSNGNTTRRCSENAFNTTKTSVCSSFFVCQIHAHTHARISFTLYSLSPCRCLCIVTYYEWNAPIHTQANKYIAHTLEAHSIIFSKKKFSVFFSLYNLSVLFFFPFSWTGPFSFFRQIKLSSNFLNRQLERNEFQKEFVSTNQSYRDLFLVFFGL